MRAMMAPRMRVSTRRGPLSLILLALATLLCAAHGAILEADAQEVSGDLIVFIDVPAASSSPGAGATISVEDFTKNIASTPAGASTTALYLSTTTTFDASAIFLGSRDVPPLGPGETNSGFITFTLPAGHAGIRYIFGRADVNSAVAEANEGNNVSQPKAITIGADLIVTIDVPGSGPPFVAGGTVTVNDWTRSDNSAPAGPSTTRFYLITGTTLDPASAIPIGSRAVPALGPSTTNFGTSTLTFPLNVAGTFRIAAKADADGAVLEANAGNNVSNASASFPLGPDLIVFLDLPAAASSVAAGTTIQLTDVTRNRGSSPVGASTTRFYLSADATLDAGDTPLGSRQVPELAPRAESTATTPLTIPLGIAGKYRVIAVADADNVNPESNEGNNTAVSSVISVGPDLKIAGATVPAKADAGTTIFVSDRTKNQGAAAAPVSRTDYYLSRDAALDAGDVLLGSRTIPPLNAGADNADTTTVDIPRTTPGGLYFVIVIADGGRAVAESDETNNAVVRPIEIRPDFKSTTPRDHLLPDFNGDGKADLLWRRPSGAVDVWLMDRSTVSSTTSYTIGWDWGIQAVGDFNGDGETDVLWRHVSGLVDMWLMDGPFIARANAQQYMIDFGWTIQGVGDFDGDGKADILWRHASGLVDMWLMDGPFIARANAQQYMIDTN